MRSLLTVIAATSLTVGLIAQSQAPVYKAVPPQYAGTYSLLTGELTQSTTFGPSTLYNNNSLTNYYSIPGLDQEWIDEGRFCGQEDVQINGFNFTYCSTQADPTQNSGTITFTFYDDLVICTGPTNGGNYVNGGFLCAYDVVGLPLGDPNGGIQCWIVTIDLVGGFECTPYLSSQTCYASDLTADEANGKLFGWGIIPRDNNTGPWLASGGKGSDNSFVWFDQLGIFQGCFWFGGAPFASFAFTAFGPAEKTEAYYPCNPVPTPGTDSDNTLFVINSNAGGILSTSYSGDVLNAFIIAGAVPNDQTVGALGTLLISLPPLFPTPEDYGGGTYSNTPVGMTAYIQVVETANGLPPNMGNLPNAWSQGYCITFQ